MPPPSADEAARFLMQATFGPSETEIARVQSLGYSGWIDEQFAAIPGKHLPYVQANYSLLLFGGNFAFMQDSFWQQAIPAPDQLRQRVKFALSQIVVVSAESGTIATRRRRPRQLRRSARPARVRQLPRLCSRPLPPAR